MPTPTTTYRLRNTLRPGTVSTRAIKLVRLSEWQGLSQTEPNKLTNEAPYSPGLSAIEWRLAASWPEPPCPCAGAARPCGLGAWLLAWGPGRPPSASFQLPTNPLNG